MKSYGLDLQFSDKNSMAHEIVRGEVFPDAPTIGKIFYLTVPIDGKEPGSYVFDGTNWITGDISSVTAGAGLIGGGEVGDVTLSLDVEAVTNLIKTTITQVTPDPVAMSMIFGVN